MIRRILLLAGLVVMIVGFGLYTGHRVHAQQVATVNFSVPREYGHCVGYMSHRGGDGLIFEASDGTIRFVNIDNGNAVVVGRR